MKKLLISVAFVLLLLTGFAVKVSALTVEISFDSTLASVNHGAKVLFPPPTKEKDSIAYGDVILIKGYVYPEGTWATEDGCTEALPMCGAEQGGGPTFPDEQVAEIICTGNFFANPFSFFPPGQNPVFGAEIGIFFLNIKFGEDNSNMLELRGRTLVGFDGSNPAEFSVLGGTGIFDNAAGEGLEIMIRPNRSGAFNFEIDLSGLTNVNMGQLAALINGE